MSSIQKAQSHLSPNLNTPLSNEVSNWKKGWTIDEWANSAKRELLNKVYQRRPNSVGNARTPVNETIQAGIWQRDQILWKLKRSIIERDAQKFKRESSQFEKVFVSDTQTPQKKNQPSILIQFMGEDPKNRIFVDAPQVPGPTFLDWTELWKSACSIKEGENVGEKEEMQGAVLFLGGKSYWKGHLPEFENWVALYKKELIEDLLVHVERLDVARVERILVLLMKCDSVVDVWFHPSKKENPPSWQLEPAKWESLVRSTQGFNLGSDASAEDVKKRKIFDAIVSCGIYAAQNGLAPGFIDWVKSYPDDSLYLGPATFALAIQRADNTLLELLWKKALLKDSNWLGEVLYISTVFESLLTPLPPPLKEGEIEFSDLAGRCRISRLLTLWKEKESLSQEALTFCLKKACELGSSRAVYCLLNAIEKNELTEIFNAWTSINRVFLSSSETGALLCSLPGRNGLNRLFLSSIKTAPFDLSSCYQSLSELIRAVLVCRFSNKELEAQFQDRSKLKELIKTAYAKEGEKTVQMLSKMGSKSNESRKEIWAYSPLQLISFAYEVVVAHYTAARSHEKWNFEPHVDQLSSLIKQVPSQPAPTLKKPPQPQPIALLKAPFLQTNASKEIALPETVEKPVTKKRGVKRKKASEEIPKEKAQSDEDPPLAALKPARKKVQTAPPFSVQITMWDPKESLLSPKSVSHSTSLATPILAHSTALQTQSVTRGVIQGKPYQLVNTVLDGDCMMDAIAIWLIRKGKGQVQGCPAAIEQLLQTQNSQTPELEFDSRARLRDKLRELAADQILSWKPEKLQEDSAMFSLISAIQEAWYKDLNPSQNLTNAVFTLLGAKMPPQGNRFEIEVIDQLDLNAREEIRQEYVSYIKEQGRYLDAPSVQAINELFGRNVLQILAKNASDNTYVAVESDQAEPITIFREEIPGGRQHYLAVKWG